MISPAERKCFKKVSHKMFALLSSPLVLLPEEGVLHTLDLDDPEFGLRNCLVEKAVNRPVAAVFT